MRKLYHTQSPFFVKPKSEWTAGIREEYEREWNKTMLTLREMLAFAANISSVNAQAFHDMLELRNSIKVDLGTLTADIKQLDALRQKIDIAAQQKKNAANNAENYKNFTRSEQVETQEQQDTPYHNTNCLTHKITCHEHCGLNEVTQHGGE